ncbi:MAG: peptidoglycan DD-metalloendopeptidase family protein [Desulfobacterium sp.]|jgi:septal ring factor EnvC (AmiA/AmiB activator)|nr:peptidoglycan DD-metalloendopeptidase family protein [Desulfobacterium sp.]
MLSFIKTVFKVLIFIPGLGLLLAFAAGLCPAMEVGKGGVVYVASKSGEGARQKSSKVYEVSKKEVLELHQKIARKEREVEVFTQREATIIEGLNDIEMVIDRMGRSITALNRELEVVKDQMVEVTGKKRALAETIDKNRDYVKARLNALYRVRMIGRMALVTMPDSIFDFFIEQNALEKILVADFKFMDIQMIDMERLAAESKKLEALDLEKQQLEADIVHQMGVKKEEGERRKAILSEIQGKKKLELAAVASLRRSAEVLEQKMAALDAIAHVDKEGFALSKGFLEMPLQGEIITFYGPSRNSDSSSFTFESGIDIKAKRGEPVRSVFKGEVLYAEWLKGYGNLIIINHGDNFYTLYAHVQEFFKKKGERVDTDEVIALAGDTGSIRGACLHFEVRHHGRPVDPMEWLKKGA